MESSNSEITRNYFKTMKQNGMKTHFVSQVVLISRGLWIYKPNENELSYASIVCMCVCVWVWSSLP